MQFMRVDADSRAIPAIDAFLEELRKGIESVEQEGGDTGRIYTYYDVNLHSKKQASAADLSVNVSSDGNGKGSSAQVTQTTITLTTQGNLAL